SRRAPGNAAPTTASAARRYTISAAGLSAGAAAVGDSAPHSATASATARRLRPSALLQLVFEINIGIPNVRERSLAVQIRVPRPAFQLERALLDGAGILTQRLASRSTRA